MRLLAKGGVGGRGRIVLPFRRLKPGKREQPEHQTLSAPVDW